MVLSLVEVWRVPVATRRPLFVGDVLIDAGAENSPLLPLNSGYLSTLSYRKMNELAGDISYSD
ncbi:unnamed protein product, partial [Ilex paraguariensis]